MKKNFKILYCTLGSLLFFTSLQARELKIGVAEFPPFKYQENNKIIGSDTEIVEEVIHLMGHTPVIDMAPWARIQHDAKTGKYDLIYSFTQTPERDKLYYFSKPINTVEDVFYKRKSDNISWKNISDLFGYSLGVSNSYKYAPELNEAIEQKKFKKIKVESGSSELKNLLNLANHETDIFICEISVCQYYLLNNPQTHAIKDKINYINQPVGDIRPFRVGFPKYPNDIKKDEASLKLRDDFDSKLLSLPKKIIEDIYTKYNIKNSL